MTKTNVIVLSGGDSDERAVSLRSGAAVSAALLTSGYTVTQLDPAHQSEDYESVLRAADVVFPVLHGKGGEDGSIQKWLEDRGIRYIGADSRASADCFDKWGYKQTLLSANLPTPRGELVDLSALWESELIQTPFVLKPFDGGSSVDTFIIRDPDVYDRKAIETAFARHPKMLLEELIEGQEITVGVLLDAALPVIEIVPPTDGEFDYENKYNGKTIELCPPQSVSQEIQTRAQDMAQQIHKLLEVRDMSRTDMMIAPNGSLYVLETNTIPGMTEQSLLPKAAGVAGYSMPELAHALVDAAHSRRGLDANHSV